MLVMLDVLEKRVAAAYRPLHRHKVCVTQVASRRRDVIEVGVEVEVVFVEE